MRMLIFVEFTKHGLAALKTEEVDLAADFLQQALSILRPGTGGY